jgi:hypothetical protein
MNWGWLDPQMNIVHCQINLRADVIVRSIAIGIQGEADIRDKIVPVICIGKHIGKSRLQSPDH